MSDVLEEQLRAEAQGKSRKELQAFMKAESLKATGTTVILRQGYLEARRLQSGLPASATVAGPPPPPTVPVGGKNKVPRWTQKCKPRQLLYMDIMADKISLGETTTAEAARNQRPEYLQYPLPAFTRYLDKMREQINKKNERRDRDAAAVVNFWKLHPKKMWNVRGEPRWEGSDAEKFLHEDMLLNKHIDMKPAALRATRIEYQAYFPKSFSSKIDQLVRKTKFQRYVRDKSKKKHDAMFGADAVNPTTVAADAVNPTIAADAVNPTTVAI